MELWPGTSSLNETSRAEQPRCWVEELGAEEELGAGGGAWCWRRRLVWLICIDWRILSLRKVLDLQWHLLLRWNFQNALRVPEDSRERRKVIPLSNYCCNYLILPHLLNLWHLQGMGLHSGLFLFIILFITTASWWLHRTCPPHLRSTCMF